MASSCYRSGAQKGPVKVDRPISALNNPRASWSFKSKPPGRRSGPSSLDGDPD